MDDISLRGEVAVALEFVGGVDAARLGVAVACGVVTLTGDVESYAIKRAAERAALRVSRVRAVASHLKVCCREASRTSDEDLAHRTAEVVEMDERIPHGSVGIVVENGCVFLNGSVPSEHQKAALDRAVIRLPGVRGIVNLLGVRPLACEEVRSAILGALKRSVGNTGNVHVRVSGDTVTLDGCVDLWNEREVVKRAAGGVPGLRTVEDHLTLA